MVNIELASSSPEILTKIIKAGLNVAVLIFPMARQKNIRLW